MQPVWWLAGLPARLGESVRDDAASRTRLSEENRHLRNELLLGAARQARLQVEAEENARLRGLLGAAERGSQDVQLAPILDVDLDPTRQRLLLNAGTRSGVRRGQAVIDAGGLVGQVIEATPTTATVLLLTDPDHAVPVAVARTGVRLIVYGTGRSDVLELRNVPLSSDVRTGDGVIRSGLGGRFPPDFSVGRIPALRPGASRAFLVRNIDGAARVDRGRGVLAPREQPLPPDRTPSESEAGAGPDAAPPADAAPADASPAPGAAR